MAFETKTNICFDCQKACGGCSWSKKFEPVPGWTAEPVLLNLGKVHSKKRHVRTYHITACPEFVKDEKRKPSHGELTEEQFAFLMRSCRKRGEMK